MRGIEQEQDQAAQQSDGFTPNLKSEEQKDVQKRVAPRAAVVHEAIREEGEEELRRSSSALAWSGLAAGLSMGFSLVAQGLLQAHLPDQPWRVLLVKLGYSIGFLIVVLGRQQLFTENTLTPILPLLARRDAATLLDVLRLWAVVLASNLAGAFLFAWVSGATGIFGSDVRQAFHDISRAALGADFGTVVLRGVFAGWLIALTVWLLPAAQSARVSIIVIITYTVGLGGFAHVVVGAIEMFYLALAGAAGWAEVLGGFMLPALIGNIIGGVSLVAALNHAQVIAGEQ